jgi:hypothetical protein
MTFPAVPAVAGFLLSRTGERLRAASVKNQSVKAELEYFT